MAAGTNDAEAGRTSPPMVIGLAASPPGAERGQGETALYMPIATTDCKFYVHYDTAWWRDIGLSTGNYNNPAPNTLSLPLNGRYHDGHARCRDMTLSRASLSTTRGPFA